MTDDEHLFHATFQHPEHAAGLLRSLLPAHVADGSDWTTLVLRPDLATGPGAEPSRPGDLLFSVRVGQGVLLLHGVVQPPSSAPVLDLLRLAGSMATTLSRYVEIHATKALPGILSLVVSPGGRPFGAVRDMRELYAVAPSCRDFLGPYQLGFRPIVDDLAGQTEERIRGSGLTARAAVTLLSLRAAGELERRAAAAPSTPRVFSEGFARWADLLGPLSPAELAPVLVYALRVGQEAPEDLRDVLLSQVSRPAAELLMTAADRLLHEAWPELSRSSRH